MSRPKIVLIILKWKRNKTYYIQSGNYDLRIEEYFIPK